MANVLPVCDPPFTNTVPYTGTFILVQLDAEPADLNKLPPLATTAVSSKDATPSMSPEPVTKVTAT